MSLAGWHKTFMAPFHTLISCDIPFVLFRLHLNMMCPTVFSQEHLFILLPQNILIYTVKVAAAFLPPHVTVSPGEITTQILKTHCFYESPVDS